MKESRPLLALKVDVDTLRGTRAGVPALVDLFTSCGAGATFLFSVGPDHTGRALRRVFRHGFIGKVTRTSVLEHYGLGTLLYGTLLPGPHIGHACTTEMRSVRSAGFEVGLHSYDHVKWQDFVTARDAEWAAREMRRGIDAFREVFGDAPVTHGAAGWQMSDAAFEVELAVGLEYASDTRGTHPFRPVLSNGLVGCPQVPTTLPTLDELIGVNGCTAADAALQILDFTREAPAFAHVYTLHAELEGMRLKPILETLLTGWTAQGYELVPMKSILDRLDHLALPRHRVVPATIPGRSGVVMTQGKALHHS